jgi:hypothetical protein
MEHLFKKALQFSCDTDRCEGFLIAKIFLRNDEEASNNIITISSQINPLLYRQ